MSASRFVCLISVGFVLHLATAAIPGLNTCVVDTVSGKVDITPLGNQDGDPRFKDIPDQNSYTYSWNPCYGFTESESCQNVELCQHDKRMDYALGSDTVAEFIQNTTHLFLSYTTFAAVVRKSYIQLICDASEEGVFAAQGELPQAVYHFTLRSKYACPKPKTTTPLTTPAATTTAVAPTPSPPRPIFTLKTITILLGCILVCICILIFMVFVGLLTRRSGDVAVAFDKKKMKF
ncbi:uncharacterized protein LOC124261000 [Haliotis rubra]|uniref:uncharacterized protein LOC124261000 n=1 Tax=Haliotis rubra TaxID=36100 RepID=UPI001EE59A47|nr:uncharacterized protein LOC124261000 [Haliotis rubra]